MTTITLTLAQIKSALLVCAKNDVRYYLNGALVEYQPNNKCRIVVTDGHRLLAMRFDYEGAPFAPAIMSIDILKHCVKAGAKLKSVDIVLDNGQSVAMGLPVALIDGVYPDYRRVIPSNNYDETPAHFRGQYIADFDKVAQHLMRDKNAMCHIKQNGNSTALVSFDATDDAIGLLMPYVKPIAPNQVEPGRPFWL